MYSHAHPMRAHIEEEPCTLIWYTDVQACSLHAHTPQGQRCPSLSTLTPVTRTHIPTGLQTPHPWRQGAQCPLTQLGGAGQDPHAMQAEVRLSSELGP